MRLGNGIGRMDGCWMDECIYFTYIYERNHIRSGIFHHKSCIFLFVLIILKIKANFHSHPGPHTISWISLFQSSFVFPIAMGLLTYGT